VILETVFFKSSKFMSADDDDDKEGTENGNGRPEGQDSRRFDANLNTTFRDYNLSLARGGFVAEIN
jgi:hypothetical protein